MKARLEDLIFELSRRSLDEDERLEFNEILRSSERAREYAASLLVDNVALERVFHEQVVGDFESDFPDVDEGSFGDAAELSEAELLLKLEALLGERAYFARKRRRLSFDYRWAVAAASIVLIMSLFFGERFSRLNRSKESLVQEGEYSTNLLAVLVNEAGAEFSSRAGGGEYGFVSGDYVLREGIVHLRMRTGVDLVVKGPSRFRIKNEELVLLDSGVARALVPIGAEGFSIGTPGVEYVDLGTEFGVSVDEAKQESSMYVFDGEVDAKADSAYGSKLRVRNGESVAYVRGVLDTGKIVDPLLFPTPEGVPLDRWLDWKKTISLDPDVVAYYSFEEKDGAKGVLQNVSSAGDALDGRIEGARWVTGRWDGKDALLFDNKDDAVFINIPESMTAFTISMWGQVNRADFPHAALMNSNGYESGDLHFQVTEYGQRLTSGTITDKQFGRHLPGDALMPLGSWVHLVCTGDTETGEFRNYINGELSSTSIRNDGVIRIGHAQIGNWEPTDGSVNRRRSFNGRIDELIIWKRSFSKAEVLDVMEAGIPDVMWRSENKRFSQPENLIFGSDWRR